MNEHFLSFVWQYQQFTTQEFFTTEGKILTIIERGRLNEHAGADFSLGRLWIEGVEWFGNIEIHIKSSDWYKHQHEKDKKYNNVILHVVWEDDKPILREDGTAIPTFELKNIVDRNLLYRFGKLLEEKKKIPCTEHFANIPNLRKITMLDKALTTRLERKARNLQKLWQNTQNDWEETAYQVLAQNFGFKVNSESFLALAEKTPYKVLLKHRDNILQMEALLFGQAGFLSEEYLKENKDIYTKSLIKEYKFLAKKYDLISLHYQNWNFLRLRPANFPTVRLSQLASLIAQQKSFFSLFLNQDLKTLKKSLIVTQSEYWQKHYVFGKESKQKVNKVGAKSVENILINTVAPLLVLYAKEKANQTYMDKALQMLEQIPAEKNKVLKKWEDLDFKVKTAYDSQALIEQYTQFCNKYQCLKCNIGVSIVRNK